MSVSADASTINVDFECYGGKGVAILRPAPPMLIGFGWIVPPTISADSFIHALLAVIAGNSYTINTQYDIKTLIKASLITNRSIKPFASCDFTGIPDWCRENNVEAPSLSRTTVYIHLPIFDGKHTFTCKIERMFEVNKLTYTCGAEFDGTTVAAIKDLTESCEALAKAGKSLPTQDPIDVAFARYKIKDFTPLWQIAAFCNNYSRLRDNGHMVKIPRDLVPKLREVATLGGAADMLKWLEDNESKL
jgi:hypothetical protein